MGSRDTFFPGGSLFKLAGVFRRTEDGIAGCRRRGQGGVVGREAGSADNTRPDCVVGGRIAGIVVALYLATTRAGVSSGVMTGSAGAEMMSGIGIRKAYDCFWA